MASSYEICIDQGTDVTIPFELYDAEDKPLDLSGYKARMQVRQSAGSLTVIDELTTENGRLFISGGTITAKWPNDKTTALKAGRYVYDIEIVSAGDEVSRILEGDYVLRREVTR